MSKSFLSKSLFFLILLLKIPLFVKNWWNVYLHIIRRLNPSDYQVKLNNGELFHIRSGIEDILVLEEVYHQKEYLKVPECIPHSSSTVIDIGGYIGDYSIQVSRIIDKSKKVIVFEPVGKLVDLINTNINLNGAYNVHVFHAAVGAKNEQTQIFFNPKLPGASSSQNAKTDSRSEIVQQFGINEIVRKENGPLFIKLDAEGAEFEIISAISSENVKKIQGLIIEYHLSEKNPSERVIVDRLSNLGFESRHIPHQYFPQIGMLYFFKN